MVYDFIIVGAGIAGITAAEQLANVHNKKVLLIDKRNHIGGNCYDYYNEEGILIHKYGPHIFHTDDIDVYNYLSLFTNWNIYNHKILGKIEDMFIPLPLNLISIDKCLPEDSSKIKSALLKLYNVNDRIPLCDLEKVDDEYLKKFTEYIYINSVNYLEKELGNSYDDLGHEYAGTIPVQVSYDCRYFLDLYQGIPTNGYTVMFENMLSNHNITILLEKDYHEIMHIDYENKKIYYEDEEFEGKVIFTGQIDEFFNYEYGKLSYQSSIIMNETVDHQYFQKNATIRYLDEYHFTQITEYKYLTGQHSDKTTIQFEFPVEYNPIFEERNIPHHIMINTENIELYNKYKQLTIDYPQITFTGQLNEHEKISMAKIVRNILDLINKIV
ncbi:UDP-galactopyranose mutase [Methanosphaera sp.]